MESFLHEMRKDVFIQARGVEFGERLLALIYWLLEMSQTARREGLLALEEAVKDVPPEIGLYEEIQWINSLIVDGTDPERVLEMATAPYWVGNFQGEDAMMYYMVVLGFRDIQAGENPRVSKDLLLWHLPPEARERYDDYEQRMDAQKQAANAQKLAAKRESLFRYDPVFEDQELLSVKKQLEEKIRQADDKMIQRWLREVETQERLSIKKQLEEEIGEEADDYTIELRLYMVRTDYEGAAMHGLSPEAKQKVLSNISEDIVDTLVENWKEACPMAHSYLMEFLGKMLRIFEDVEKKLAEE